MTRKATESEKTEFMRLHSEEAWHAYSTAKRKALARPGQPDAISRWYRKVRQANDRTPARTLMNIAVDIERSNKEYAQLVDEMTRVLLPRPVI
jgi:hypothetical protein